MARQVGPVMLRGTFDDINFYQTKEGYYARRKGGPTKKQVARLPAFAALRDNGEEFKSVSALAKTIRDGLRPLLQKMPAGRMQARLVQLLLAIAKKDPVHVRGKRTVAGALALPEARGQLHGFNFNKESPLEAVLQVPYSLDPATGSIGIARLLPGRDLIFPEGTTHLRLTVFRLRVDAEGKESQLSSGPEIYLPVDAEADQLELKAPEDMDGQGFKLFLLQIEFILQVRQIRSSLRKGQFTVLCLTGAA